MFPRSMDFPSPSYTNVASPSCFSQIIQMRPFKAIGLLIFFLVCHAVVPLGILWACSCRDVGSSCIANVVLKYGLAVGGGASILTAGFSLVVAPNDKRMAPAIAVINFVSCEWMVCTLVASFFCTAAAGGAPSVHWAFASPVVLISSMAVIHCACIVRGKVMPLWYRGTFAVAYSVAISSSALLFLFTPAIAAIPYASLAWIPLGVAVLLSSLGVAQSWTSPRELSEWELVTIDCRQPASLLLPGSSSTPKAIPLQRITLGMALRSLATTCDDAQSALSVSDSSAAQPSMTWAANSEQAAWLKNVVMPCIHRMHLGTTSGVVVEDSPSLPLPNALEVQQAPRKDFLTVVQITDPHLGSFVTPERLRRIAERALLLQPDVILLTGDFFTREAHEEPDALAWALEPLRAVSERVFACYGNHDLEGPGVKKLVDDTMERIHATLLCDASAVIQTQAGPVEIIGLNYNFPHMAQSGVQEYFDSRRQQPNSNAKRDQQPDPQNVFTIVMLHDPSAFSYLPRDLNALVVSGHTHGGHIGLYSLGWEHATLLSLVGLCDNGLWVGNGNWSYIHRGQGARSLASQAIVRLGVPSEDSVMRIRLR